MYNAEQSESDHLRWVWQQLLILLSAKFLFPSIRHSITSNRPTGLDEMCNFYLMYYVEDDEPLIQSSCFSSGPPEYYWKNDDTLRNIPDADASQLDNTPDNGTQMHMHMMPTAEQKHTSTTGQAHTNSCSIFLTLLFAASMHITNLVHFWVKLKALNWCHCEIKRLNIESNWHIAHI